MTRWRLFWFGALSALLVVELWTVVDPRPGDTLSEQVVPLLEVRLVWTLTLLAWLAFAAWLAWHWWFERRGPG